MRTNCNYSKNILKCFIFPKISLPLYIYIRFFVERVYDVFRCKMYASKKSYLKVGKHFYALKTVN